MRRYGSREVCRQVGRLEKSSPVVVGQDRVPALVSMETAIYFRVLTVLLALGSGAVPHVGCEHRLSTRTSM